MVKRILLALIASSAPALAQPGITDPETPPPTTAQVTTPTVVAAPQVTTNVAPWIARKGNLRLSIVCAESWVTPNDGLGVSVDGRPTDAQGLNGSWGNYTDSDGNNGETWNASDTGYLLQPGPHHVSITSPGCAPSEFDMTADPLHSTHAIGRLAVDDWSLQGPVGAPNGISLTGGLILMPTPQGSTSNPEFSTNYSFGPQTMADGGFISLGWEHRNFAFAFDQAFASGSISGAATSTLNAFPGEPSQTSPFSGSVFDWRSQLRVGARLPLQYVALAGGSGIGLDAWFYSAQTTSNQSLASPPNGADGSLYLPLWAAATVKPSCDWGVQAIGQYDVHPGSMDTNGFTLMAGVTFQPSASCREAPGVRVD
ncbi:MAG TPA: hypothetical protein VGG28_29400 [Kofleriaceae bacterium]|jgi:hypothetical protein